MSKFFLTLCFALVFASPAMSDVLERINKSEFITEIEEPIQLDLTIIDILEDADVLVLNEITGGYIEHAEKIIQYVQEHPQVVIVMNGECYSACTLLLKLSNNVVFTENASFYFHSSIEVNSGLMSKSGNKNMLDILPTKIENWVVENKAFRRKEFTKLEMTEAKALLPSMFLSSVNLPEVEYLEMVDLNN